MSLSSAYGNDSLPFARMVYPDGSGYEERGGTTYPIQLKGPQTWRINPGKNMGITNPNLGKAKLMNAVSGPFKGGYPLPGMDWLEKKLFGDPQDKQGPPIGEDGKLLPGWELHQDGWNYFPPNEGEEQYEDVGNQKEG